MPVAPPPKIQDLLGGAAAPTNDPAWQPPADPLADGKIATRAGVVHREIPLIVCGTGWDVAAVRLALEQQSVGLFDYPAQLADSIAGDSRVQAAMASRTGGVLGRPVDFLLPRKYADSALAKECRDAFADAWPTMAAEASMAELQRNAVSLGFGISQILWDTSGDYMIPRPLPWHLRSVYWHWTFRCFVAMTQDGPVQVRPGDGSWILHAPHGEYRGWMQGAIRAIAPWWLARHYALRDWARYSERHGLPMIKAKTPARGDPVQVDAWTASLQTLGQETVIQLPQEVDGSASYDVDLLEARDTAHDGFRQLISQCDTEITLSLLAQNLTTEVKEGSFAAARVHADVRQALLEADARGLALTIYQQLARPFAAMNFGEPDIAPRVVWNVEPYEDAQTKAQTLLTFTQSLANMKNAGFRMLPEQAERIAKSFGLDVGQLREVETAIAGASPPATPGAQARFAAMAEKHARYRIAIGETSRRYIEAETEAMAAMFARQEVEQSKAMRRRRRR